MLERGRVGTDVPRGEEEISRQREGRDAPLHALGQPVPEILALFPERGGMALDRQKDLGAFRGPEASGDLLADFDHPEVLLGLVVWNGMPGRRKKRGPAGCSLVDGGEDSGRGRWP